MLSEANWFELRLLAVRAWAQYEVVDTELLFGGEKELFFGGENGLLVAVESEFSFRGRLIL